jgi:hypothetical protein
MLDLETACAFCISWPNQTIAARQMLALLAHFSISAKPSDKAEGVEGYVRTDAAILVRESPKAPRRLSERIRNRRNCARLEQIWNMDFQRQIEIELFEIRRSHLHDPGVVVGSVARVVLQGMNLALHCRHLVV